jgi:hypothetical protein
MTTKREIERLARKALGRGAFYSSRWGDAQAWTEDVMVSVDHDRDDERRELLAAALRGIIAWKEGK